MVFIGRKPSAEAIDTFLQRQRGQPLAYAEVGSSCGVPPRQYTTHHHRICLGTGQRTFDVAKAAMQSWRMFPSGWLQLCWPEAPVVPGTVVAILARWGCLWWLNACRLVYVIDEIVPRPRCGFAYGTLPDHAERGEERFTIEWCHDDTVWYEIVAFSRPGHWLVWLGSPFARRLQKRFAVDSLAAMARAVREHPPQHTF